MGSATSEAKREEATTKQRAKKVWPYLVLLTLQYGTQPLISKRFVRRIGNRVRSASSARSAEDSRSSAPSLANGRFLPTPVHNPNSPTPSPWREVIVTSLVLSCELAKVICALILLAREGTLKKQFDRWTIVGSLTASGLPAAIYALQNSLLQISYKNLDSLTFSILNQTKIFFTALFTYIILGQKQSAKQVLALTLLIIAAILLSVGESSGGGSSGGTSDHVLFYGIIPVMVASVLSGLASSLCQWASQVKKHTSYLMTVEMSLFGSMCLLASTYQSPDGEAIRKYGFFHGWTVWTLIPVISNAVGGILVGLVTAYAGGVRKGFVIVSALLVTALLQFFFDGKPPSLYCLAALPLVITSIFIYQKYPYTDRKKKD